MHETDEERSETRGEGGRGKNREKRDESGEVERVRKRQQ